MAAYGVDGDVRSKEVLEILLDLLDPYPTLNGAAPLIMQTFTLKRDGRRLLTAGRPPTLCA